MTTQLFQFEGQKVRHVILEGEPWFVAADVCRCLGLGLEGGAGRHLGRLDEDERKTVRKREALKGQQLNCGAFLALFAGSESALTLISESGLIKLAMKAEKATARAFQNWIAREVIPSIRKTGTYSLPHTEAPQEPAKALPGPAASHVDLVALVDRYEARTDALIGHIGKLVDLRRIDLNDSCGRAARLP